jgi:hypothetical protein
MCVCVYFSRRCCWETSCFTVSTCSAWQHWRWALAWTQLSASLRNPSTTLTTQVTQHVISTPEQILRKVSGVTQKNFKKITYARILILFDGNVVRCWVVSSTINCLSC